MSSQIPPEQAIREQAAEWAVLLDAGCLSPGQTRALAEWRDSDPRHAQALDLAVATWADLGRLGHLDAPPVASPVVAPARPVTGRRRRSRLGWAASSAAVLLLAVFAVDRGPAVWLRMSADYVATGGEVRQVSLPDGSTVDLDSGSAINVVYSDTERRVKLLAGDAMFDAAPVGAGEVRPFVVEYAGASTQALGTRFVVGGEGRGGWVGMLEHSTRVSLQAPPASGAAERVLNEGQSLRYDQAQGVRLWPEQDVRRASAWQRGLLVFEREPLGQVVERINRYRGGRVVIADSALARREVSGMFRLDNLDQAVVMLTDELRASRVDVPGLTLIY